MVVCGVLLVGVMAFISLGTADILINGGPGKAQFTGTQQEKLIIIALFGVIMLFGFVALLSGLYQLIFGRRNKIFVWATIAIAVLISIGGGAVIWLFDK